MTRAAGFSPSANDPALFIHLSPRDVLCFFYMLITSDDVENISHVKQQLGEQFQIYDDLGPLSYFLGIELSHSA